MVRIGFYGWLLGLAFALCPVRAFADEWLPPKVETYYSQNHHARFTVTPRDISNPLAYFDGKVRNEQLAGQRPGSKQTVARGILEKQDSDRHWTVVWDRALVNDVSPVSAVVANSARYVVTFDNWHSMGWGNDAVVVYGPGGSIIRSLGLNDILPGDYVYALPRSVSSIWWSGEHRIAEPNDILILKVAIPSEGDDRSNPQYAELPILLATGQVQSPAAGSWQQALAQATRAAQSKRAAEEANDLRFKSPLVAPKNTVEPDWHTYLGEAFYRLDPDWKESGAWTTVLRSPDAEDYAPSEGWVREDLEGKGIGDVIMLASPASPEKLIIIMETTIPKLKRDVLKGKRVYVCVPIALRDRAEKALVPTGAKFIYLDPDLPIPQRPERLKRYFYPDQD
jgi:hypothetical protein